MGKERDIGKERGRGRDREKGIRSPGAVLHASVNNLTRVLGTNFGSSAGTIYSISHCATSPGQKGQSYIS